MPSISPGSFQNARPGGKAGAYECNVLGNAPTNGKRLACSIMMLADGVQGSYHMPASVLQSAS